MKKAMEFSKRKKLADDFEKWAISKDIKPNPFNMIAYLQIKGELRDGFKTPTIRRDRHGKRKET